MAFSPREIREELEAASGGSADYRLAPSQPMTDRRTTLRTANDDDPNDPEKAHLPARHGEPREVTRIFAENER